MAVIGGRNVGTNDLVVMGAGALMFIDSFLPWYGVSIHGFGSATVSGWNAGFGAWFSILLVIAVAVVAAVRVFGGRSMPAVGNGSVSWNLITAGVSALAFIIMLIRWLTFPSGGHGVDAGGRFGIYIGLIIAIVQTVYGYLSITAAGEKMPWQNRPA
jgi:hypothetical protein